MSNDQKPQGAGKPATEVFHVAGPGSIVLNGETYKAGELVNVTKEEATELGALVVRGTPKPPPPDASKRTAGRYRFIGDGTCIYKGQAKKSGAQLELTESEARSLGDAIEAI